MSHEIETHEDQAAFVSARELPWHKLGTVTPDVLTAEAALEIAHLSGWNVRKNPLQTVVGDEILPVKDKFAVVRDNPWEAGKVDVLGTVGKHYAPVQNEEHVEFLNTLTEASGAFIETAGSLKGGKEVFVTMKAPDHILIGGVDPVDMYLAALNTHDGSKSFRVIATPVRVVCANTQRAALASAKASVSIRHTSGHGGAVARARDALGIAFKYEEEFQAEAEKMIQETMTNLQFNNIVSRLYPINEAQMSDLQ